MGLVIRIECVDVCHFTASAEILIRAGKQCKAEIAVQVLALRESVFADHGIIDKHVGDTIVDYQREISFDGLVGGIIELHAPSAAGYTDTAGESGSKVGIEHKHLCAVKKNRVVIAIVLRGEHKTAP